MSRNNPHRIVEGQKTLGELLLNTRTELDWPDCAWIDWMVGLSRYRRSEHGELGQLGLGRDECAVWYNTV